MAYKKTNKTATQVADEIKETITNKFLECLDKGKIPWRQTWNSSSSGFLKSDGKSYSFMNTLLLALGGGTVGEYVTLKAIEERTHTSAKDGTVWQFFERGEDGKPVKGHRVYFYTRVEYNRKNADGSLLLDSDGNAVKGYYPLLKASTVWQIGAQVHIPLKFEKKDVVKHNNNPIYNVDKVVIDYQAREGVKINFLDNVTPAYSPTLDAVHIPHIEEYETSEAYYADLLHEIAHSSGHEKRLKRDLGKMDRKSYSYEELIAEICSCCIMHDQGINTDEYDKLSEAYVQGWAKALRSDKTIVEKACRAAIKAAEFIYSNKE